METAAEVSRPTEIRPPTAMGSEIYGSGRQTVNLSFAEFAFGKKETTATPENSNPKRMVVFLAGWPWDASAKPTWDFPGQLSEGLNATCYSITTRSERDNPEGMALQASATRQFLMEQGVDEKTQVIIATHSAGVRKGAYFAKNMEDNNLPPALLVSISPMGLNSRSMVGLLKDFVKDTFITGKKERKIAGVKAGDKPGVADKVSEQEVQQGFKDSLKKKWQVGGIRGLWSQIKGLVQEDPIYSQIKVPIINIANDRDMVSNHRSYLPVEGVKISGADVRARQDERVRLAKAREIIAQQNKFKQSQRVDVVVPTRQADHNGIPVVRGEQVPGLIERTLNLIKRSAGKTA